MGTEQIFPVGTILTRKEPKDDNNDKLRVVGTGHEIVVTPHEEFAPNFAIDVKVARNEYTYELPEGTDLQTQPKPEDSLSPEQIFANAANKDAKENKTKPATGRGRTSVSSEEKKEEANE